MFRRIVLVLSLLPASLVIAQPEPDPPVRYVLTAEALYEEGCFDPCMCPIFMAPALYGAFLLDEIEPATRYALSAIAWEIPMFDGAKRYVVGGGSLTIDPSAGSQRLVLELSIDGGPVHRYDSGEIEPTAKWPEIDLAVSRNGMFCYDWAFYVRAEPATTIGVAESTRWGALKSLYR